MDAVRIERLTALKSLVNKNASESTDLSKGNDDIFVDEIDEDDEIRLRLSDDEEFEQDLISGFAESQQTNLQLKKNDLVFDNCILSKKPLSRNNKCTAKQNLSAAETKTLTSEDESSGNSSLDEKIANEIFDVDGSKKMSGNDRIPPLLHNSPKYWSNGFRPVSGRWKGDNSSRDRSFSHRKPNDWYNKQYPENEKFNKNNFSKHSKNHFKTKTRDNSREPPKNQSIDSLNRESEKINKNHSSILEKSSLNKSIENGVTDQSPISKENYSLEKNDNFSDDKTEQKKLTFDEKENVSVPGTCSEPEQKSENKSSEILKKDGSILDTKNDKSVFSKNKDCDNSSEVSEEKDKNTDNMTKGEKEEINDKNNESKENENSSKTKISSELNEVVTEESSSENFGDKQSDMVMKINEDTPILIEDYVENSVVNSGDCNKSDAISANQDSKKKSLSDEEDSEKQLDEETDEKTDNESTDEQDKPKNDRKVKLLEMNEDSNISLRSEKSLDISEMDISDHTVESFDTEKKLLETTDKIDESMDVENDEGSSSSSLLAVTENQKSDTRDSNISNDIEKVNQKNESSVQEKNDDETESEHASKNELSSKENKIMTGVTEQKKITDIEEVDLIDDETDVNSSTTVQSSVNNTSKTEDDAINKNISLETSSSPEDSNVENCLTIQKKRRRRGDICLSDNFTKEVLNENGARIKRRSAQNAEEMIRKGIQKNDEEDEEDPNESNNFVSVGYNKSNLPEPLSPPTLKRTLDDLDSIHENTQTKKLKAEDETLSPNSLEKKLEVKEIIIGGKEKIEDMKELVKTMSQEDIRRKIKKMTKEEMEAVLLHKIVECIAVRGEMGKLREQARNTRRNLEATRSKCQSLQKQVDGFDMVLKRISYDKSNNADKYVQPIKINRSVGLQVNFVSDHSHNSIINLKQMQALKASGQSNLSAQKTTATSMTPDHRSMALSPKKMVKTRSPRAMPTPPTLHPIINTTASTNNSSSSSVVVNKSVEQPTKRYSVPASNSVVYSIPSHNVVVNSNVNMSGGTTRTNSVTIQRTSSSISNNSSDLIDLTDEEEKTKTTALVTPATAISRPRVLQAVPASVASNIRLVQTSSGSPTALNNIATPTVAYVMQTGVSGSRQIVLKSANTIRQVTTPPSGRNISTIYKPAVQAVNGAVRVLTSQTQVSRQHPAPLPETPQMPSNPLWKLPPPAPSLKINKVATGIVLSWNMNLNDKFSKIASYQLFAYQEITGTPPNSALWKKVGDVAALPLPMACTLTQFTEGNSYHFAVRAVDDHRRCGAYSKPGNISL